MEKRKFKITWVEITVIAVVLIVVGVIIYPIFAKSRIIEHQIPCISNLRQLAMAVLMYNQDNKGKLPGIYDENKKYIGWVNNIKGYIKPGKHTTIDDTFH